MHAFSIISLFQLAPTSTFKRRDYVATYVSSLRYKCFEATQPFAQVSVLRSSQNRKDMRSY